MRHILTKKSTKSKRQLRGASAVDARPTCAPIRAMLPYSRKERAMPRVKRGVTARARHKKVLEAGQGFPRPPQQRLPHRQGSGDEGGAVRLPRPPQQEARLPRAVDRAHQRGGARARHDLQRVHDRPEEGRDRDRPQGAGRPRGARQAGVRQDRRARSKPASAPEPEPAQKGGSRGLLFLSACDKRTCKTSNRIVDEALADFAAAATPPRSSTPRRATSARAGALTELLEGPRQARRRRAAGGGRAINAAKAADRGGARRAARSARRRASSTRSSREEALDVTLPGRGRGTRRPASGHRAPGSASRRSFRSIGFDVADGPEIETDCYNFTALNKPGEPSGALDAGHVLRRQDGKLLLLRTHTSPMQVRYAQHAHSRRSRSSRRAAPTASTRDATHSPMFHQVEGLWIDEDISFADLKGVTPTSCAASSRRDDLRCASVRRSSRSPSRRPRST